MNLKKIIALALCVCMVLSFFPVSVFAEDWEDEVVLVDEEEYFEPQDEYVEEEIIIEEPVDYVEYVEPAEELIVEDELPAEEPAEELIEEPAEELIEEPVAPATPVEEAAAPAAMTANLETAETFDDALIIVAECGDKSYTSLQEAIDDNAGKTITVVKDCGLDEGAEALNVRNNVTIAGGAKVFTGNVDITADATISDITFTGNVDISADAKISNTTFNGTVTVDGGKTAISGSTLTKTAGSVITISNGELTLDKTTLNGSTSAAAITMNGGKLTVGAENANDMTFNCVISVNVQGGTLTIPEGNTSDFKVIQALDSLTGNVMGGAFANEMYIPANLIAPGYGYVTDGVKFVGAAMIGTQAYDTLEEAIYWAAAGDTIKLLKDIEANLATVNVTNNGVFNIEKNITIDGNGKTITAVGETGLNVHVFNVTSPATIKNVTIVGNGNNKMGIHAYGFGGTGVLTLEKVTTTNNYGYGVCANGAVVTATNLNTSGNGWGGVNVDHHSEDKPAGFTLNGGTVQSLVVENTLDPSDAPITAEIEAGTVSSIIIQGKEENIKVTKSADVNVPAPEGYGWDTATGKKLVKLWKVSFWNEPGSTEYTALAEDVKDGEFAWKPPVDPKITGYSFAAWVTEANCPAAEIGAKTYHFGNPASEADKITKDTPLYARFYRNNYTLKYDPNGGQWATGTDLTVPKTFTVGYDKAVEEVDNPEREGYTFDGWEWSWTDEKSVEHKGVWNDTTIDPTAPAKMPAGNLTFTAHWTANSYTVTFNPDGGKLTKTGGSETTESYTETYDFDATVDYPTATKDGYTFSKWYWTGKGNAPEKMPAANMSVKPIWTANDASIVFDAGEGAVIPRHDEDNVSKLTINGKTDALIEPAIKGDRTGLIPSRDGYQYAGWFDKVTETSVKISELPAKMPANGASYEAHWTANNYTVEFNKNNAAATGEMAPQSFTYDEAAKALSENTFTLTGYTFAGWYFDVDCTDAVPATVQNLTKDKDGKVTVYAKWTAKDYQIEYVDVPEGYNGPDKYSFDSVKPDGLQIPNPVKEGYSFAGWTLTITNGTKVTTLDVDPDEKIPAADARPGDRVYTAHFNKYVAQLTDGAGTVTPYDSIEGAKEAYDLHPSYYHGIELLDTTVEYTLPYDKTIVILNPGEWTPAGNKSLDNVTPYYVVPGVADQFGAVEFTTADCEAAVYDLTITVSRDQAWEYHTKLTASTLAAYYDTFALAAAAVVNQTGNVNPEAAGTYNAKAVKVLTAVPDDHKYGLNVDSTVVFEGEVRTDLFTAQDGVIYADGDYVSAEPPFDDYKTVSAAYKTKTVSFDHGSGAGSAEAITITYGSTANLPAADTFTKSDYSFIGYTSGNVVVLANQTELTVDQVNALIIADGETATLTAQYVGDTITVVFNSNNGTGTMEEQEFTAGDSKKLTANSFERTGYNFNGWVLDAEAETVMYADEATVGPTVFAALNKAAVDHRVTLYALWSPDEFQIAFNKNGGTGTVASVTASYDSPVTLANNTYKKTGYSFASWNTQETGEGTNFANSAELTAEQVNALHALVVDGTVTLYAKWNANEYTIVFDANNESATGTTASVSATYDVEATLTSNGFELVGYNFAGWDTKSDGTGKSYDDEAIVKNLSNAPGAEVTLYAQWTADEFNIAFSANDTAATGTTATLEDVKYDAESATLPANGFRKTGNTFNLWSDGTNTYGNKASLTSDQIHYLYSLATADDEGVKTVTLNATWKVNTYKISFNNNNGEGTMDQVSYTYGAAAVELPLCTFTYHGKVFAGWNTKANGSGTSYEDGAAISPASNLTLYAQWEDDTFTVVFNGNNETSGTMADLPLTYGVSTNLPENAFLRTGFGFEGWSLDPNAVTADFAGDKDLIGPTRMEALYNAVGDNDTVTIYAVWAAVNTKVTFDANKGKVINPATEKSVSKYTVTGDFGASIVWPADPTRTGYTFSGWSTDEFDTFPAEDVTVTAAWTVNQYTVSFYDVNADGTKTHYEGKDVTQDYNTAFTPPTVEKEGFDFAGWFDEAGNQMPDKIPAANTAYYAKWTGEDVVITWIDRSETIASRTQKNGELTDQPSYEGRSYGNKIVDPTDPWSPEVSQYVNGAAVYTLKWKDIISVDFIANGINVGSGSAIDGHPIMEAPNVKKDGKDPVWHINGKDGDVYTIGVTPVDSSIATLVASWDDTPATLADFTYNMSLTENLNMKFFVRNVKDNFEDYTVKVSIDGEDDHVFYLDNAEENIFTIAEFDARRMTDEIHVVVTDGDAVALTGVYTIAGYCNAVIESTGNEKLKELANAILVYGANAQIALNYKTENLPTDDYDVDGVIIPTATATTKGSVTGVSRFGNQVMVDSNVTLRVLLQVDSTASLDDYTVTVNDTEVVPVKQSATIWYVDIPVSALKLGERQIVYVEDDDGMATYALTTIVPMRRVNNALTKALYAYYDAATAYATSI